MTRSHQLPNLIAQLGLVTFVAAMLSTAPTTLALYGLLGLAAAVGLQAAGRSRDAALMNELRRLAEEVQSGRRRLTNGRM